MCLGTTGLYAQSDSGNITILEVDYFYKIKPVSPGYTLTVTGINTGKSEKEEAIQKPDEEKLTKVLYKLFNKLKVEDTTFTGADTAAIEKAAQTMATAIVVAKAQMSNVVDQFSDQPWFEHVYFAAGATFDFQDGITPNEFYADITGGSYFFGRKLPSPLLFKPHTETWKDIKNIFFYNNWGAHAGLYQIEATSLNTVDSGIQYRRINFLDSARRDYITDTAVIASNISQKVIALFGEPKFCLLTWRNGSTTLGGYLGLAVRFEYSYAIQNINRNYEYYTLSDTSSTRPRAWGSASLSSILPTSRTENLNLHNIMVLPGYVFMVPYRSGYIEFKGFLGTVRTRELTATSLSSTVTRGYYLFRLNILETKLAGLKVGADLRGVLFKKNLDAPSSIERLRAPALSIYLSKTLTFKAVGAFLTPSGGGASAGG